MLGATVAERVTPSGIKLRAEANKAEADAARFRELMDAELDASYRLAATILRDAAEAEDAVHDAAVAAWRNWHQLREPSNAQAWFRRILINSCRDRLRRRRLRSRFEVLRRPANTEVPAIPDSSLETVNRDALRDGLRHLNPDERIAVVLRFGHDLTVPATAESLGIAEGTVKSRLHTALRKLRANLGEGER